MASNRAKVIGIDDGMASTRGKKVMISSTHWEVQIIIELLISKCLYVQDFHFKPANGEACRMWPTAFHKIRRMS